MKKKKLDQVAMEQISATRMPFRFQSYNSESLVNYIRDSVFESNEGSGSEETIAAESALIMLTSYCTNIKKAFLKKDDPKRSIALQSVLYIHGPPRSFKTFMLTSALRVFAVDGQFAPVRYYTFDEVCDSLFINDRPHYFRDTFLSPGILGIDNVTAPKHEGYRRALNRLARLRIDYGRPLLIASDLPPEDFERFYSLPRVIEMNDGKTEQIDDGDAARLIINEMTTVLDLRK